MDDMNFRDIDQENDLLDVQIKVLDAKKYNFNRNYSSRIQFHPFTYFYYIVKGNGKLSIENEIVDIKDSDLVVINSNIGHTVYVDGPATTCQIIGFGVESLSVSRISQNQLADDNCNYFHTSIDEKYFNTNIFNEIVDEYKSDKLFSNAMANAKAAIFIIKVLRQNDQKVTVSHDKKVNRQIDYIKNYIDNNYSEDIKLEQLSTMAYMNKFHLISEFKQSYRVTPIEYLILKRIEIAKNLLISTNHSMEEIYSIVGFNSQSYFNQVFKKKVGQTPSQFRKKHRL